MIAITNLLVATDFSEVSGQALAYGRMLAERFGATLHVVHVVEDITTRNVGVEAALALTPELQADLENAARKQLEALGAGEAPRARGEAHVIKSNATAHAIVEFASEMHVDLIAIGTHGRGGMSRLLLGSVAERVVRTARCPVLTVHSPERESGRQDASPAGAAA